MAKQHAFDYDLIVIGSGAGGSVAAHIVARAGKRVALVEVDTFGGESTNWGCIPTKALLHAAEAYDDAKAAHAYGIRSVSVSYNYPSIRAWKDLVVKRTGAENSRLYHKTAGIDVFEGLAHFISPHQITVNRRHLSAAHFIVATGSGWSLPSIIGLEDTDYLTSRTAIDLIRPPKSLFIIGAGAVGCEYAQFFSTFGTKVYLADVAMRVLPKEDQEVGELVERLFQTKRGVTLLTSSKILQVVKDGAYTRVTFRRGNQDHTVKVDEILLAAGKRPNTDLGLENAGVEYTPTGIKVNEQLQTSAKHIYAAGDVLGVHNYTHTATYQSRVVAHNILHREKLDVDYRAVPRVTFLTPEVASVGLSEDDCLRRDMTVKIGLAPLNIIARSNTSNFTDGFVKVIANKAGVVIGATVVSPRAGEVLQELTLAIQYEMTAAQIANTLHAFPTWSEAVRVACSKI